MNKLSYLTLAGTCIIGGSLTASATERVTVTESADTRKATAADNSQRNEAIIRNNEPTSEDQSNAKADRELTAKIRRAVVKDDSLSLNAQNIKIITKEGKVVLKGPVNSEDERNHLAKIAKSIAGESNVKSDLELSH